MKLTEIIADIDTKIAQLQQARDLLTGTPAKAKRGRPTSEATRAKLAASEAVAQQPARRTMSVEGRARVAAAQKERWAKVKKANRKAELDAQKLKADKSATRASAKSAGKKSASPAKAASSKKAVKTPKAEPPTATPAAE